MLFFKRILKQPEPDLGAEPEEMVPPVERRSATRFTVQPDTHIKTVLSIIPRDDSGTLMSNSRHGWNWRCRLLDCSEQGLRLQLGPVVKADAGDYGEITLEMEEFLLRVPIHIANVSVQEAGVVLGLKHHITEEKDWQAYRQLLEVVALGSTLRRKFKKHRVDASGYLTEQYASDRPSRLTAWRNPADGSVAAFEFQLKDSLVRGAEGRAVKYLTGTGADLHPAPAAQSLEIQRLFRWVVPNLSLSVPEDVRKFLQRFGA
jgi:hypothetical protein